MLTQIDLKRQIHYDPETGIFTWISGIRTGYEAGNLDKYRVICIARKKYTASQLAWLYMTGEFPGCILDHENTIRADDSWKNLRKASSSQNNHNRSVHYNSELGVKGVRRSGNRFMANIRVNGTRIYLGHYMTIEEASNAYKAAAIEHFGEFAKW